MAGQRSATFSLVAVGARNAALIAPVVLLCTALLALALVYHTELTIWESLIVAPGIFFVISTVAGLAQWLHSRHVRGPILLDCGPHPWRWLFLFCAAFVGLQALLIWLGIPDTYGSLGTAAPATFFAMVAASNLAMAAGRLQLFERGLWGYWGLLRWERIASYRWADDSTLFIRPRRFMVLSGAIRVPEQLRHLVDAALRSHGVPEEA